MDDVIEFLVFLTVFAAVLAWQFVFPVIGLLYCIGWLK